MTWLRALAACLFALLLFAPSLTEAKRVALVVGNDAYVELPALQKAKADATGFAGVLTSKGFDQVIVREDLNGQAFNVAISEFLDAIEPGDTAVFMYSGHGWSDGSENFLVGTDAPKAGAQTLLARISIPLQNGVNGIIDEMGKRGAALKVAIVDACRDNPFATGGRSIGMGRGLARVDPPSGTFVVFSAGAGQTALDRLSDSDPNPNSVFTRVFLPLLAADMPLLDAVKATQQQVYEVARLVEHEQEPAYYDQVRGSACLSPSCTSARTASVAGTSEAVASRANQDSLFWTSIAASNNPADFHAYLDAFPNGAFAPLAHNRLAALTPADSTAIGGVPTPIDECDRLAASPVDKDNPSGVTGVALEALASSADEAVAACRDAVAAHPDSARFQAQLGRALEANKQYTEARHWYEMADGLGNALAANNLGSLYLEGWGGAKDLARAADLYRRAADRGMTLAMTNLANLYELGDGVPQDFGAARMWLEKAASLGDRAAMHGLGVLWDQGWGGDQDYLEAARWYERAAGLGETASMNNLGRLYAEGRGVPQDYAKSFYWYEKAASLGLPEAMFNLAVAYVEGRGTVQDYGEALRWFKEAAALGNSEAMLHIGNMYSSGMGVDQNEEEARRWYERSSNLGNDGGIHNLALRYMVGAGGPRDTRKAAELFLRAMASGNEFTFDNLRADPQSYDRDVRRAIQQFLIDNGFLAGSADGVFGRKTIAALDSYRQSLASN